MTKDSGIPEDDSLAAELENELEQLVSDYLVSMSQGLTSLANDWGLEEGPKLLRLERRLVPILERSVAEIVEELKRALGPLAAARKN